MASNKRRRSRYKIDLLLMEMCGGRKRRRGPTARGGRAVHLRPRPAGQPGRGRDERTRPRGPSCRRSPREEKDAGAKEALSQHPTPLASAGQAESPLGICPACFQIRKSHRFGPLLGAGAEGLGARAQVRAPSRPPGRQAEVPAPRPLPRRGPCGCGKAGSWPRRGSGSDARTAGRVVTATLRDCPPPTSRAARPPARLVPRRRQVRGPRPLAPTPGKFPWPRRAVYGVALRRGGPEPSAGPAIETRAAGRGRGRRRRRRRAGAGLAGCSGPHLLPHALRRLPLCTGYCTCSSARRRGRLHAPLRPRRAPPRSCQRPLRVSSPGAAPSPALGTWARAAWSSSLATLGSLNSLQSELATSEEYLLCPLILSQKKPFAPPPPASSTPSPRPFPLPSFRSISMDKNHFHYSF